jgi:low temperature requirement protein LtrA
LCGLLLPIILICNYTPPFVAHRLLVKSEQRLDLSSSMFERLGLFTIIIFGELVFGVINGVSKIERLGWVDWIGFALATGIVFSLWWIFFTFVSTREVKKGFARASALELLYIPALIALCVIAACLPESFNGNADAAAIRNLMQYGIAAFLFCIVLITTLLEYPAIFVNIKRPMRLSLLFTAFVFLALGLANFECDQTLHWIIVIIVVVAEIAYLNYIYYSRLLKEGLEPVDVT